MTDDDMPPRALSRQETHDLSMIIKDRAKVLKAHAAEEAAACLADFEEKITKVHKFDDDDVWAEATRQAERAVKAAQAVIDKQCKALGIPKAFAPQLQLSWNGRGEAAVEARRVELRRVAKAQIEAMEKAAVTRIERLSLDLRSQVVAMGFVSAQANLFLESLAPIEETMRSLDFGEIERKMLADREARRAQNRRLGYGDY